MRPGTTRYDSTTLAKIGVLVIANAVNAANEAGQNWRLPIVPAFDSSEIASISAWVKRGGSLWIIADHMPFAGAAADLARSVGVIWLDGFALPEGQPPDPRTGDYPITFRRSDGSLGALPPVRGRGGANRFRRDVHRLGVPIGSRGAGRRRRVAAIHVSFADASLAAESRVGLRRFGGVGIG